MSGLEQGDAQRFIVYRAGVERYCLPLGVVRQVVDYRDVTPVPSGCRWLLGVVNIRGEVVPVLDLAARFGAGDTPPSDRACILVIETALGDEVDLIGVIAQRIEDLVVISDADAIVPAPMLIREAQLVFIRGVTRIAGELAFVIDADRAFDLHDLGDAIRTAGAMTAAETNR